MTQLLAGSAFGQVLGLKLGQSKTKSKINKFGLMKKQKITSIIECTLYLNAVFYSSQKNVYSCSYIDQTQSKIFNNSYNASKIIGIHSHHSQSIVAALDNGTLFSVQLDEKEVSWQNKEILAGKIQSNSNKHYNKVAYDQENSFCFVGKEVLPFLFNTEKNAITWNGKNVPHDQLDLRVPVENTDAIFFKNKNQLACAHADSRVRVYDVRTNKQKPSADYSLKFQKVYTKAILTKIINCKQNQNLFYVSNDLGAIYESDIRKQMQMTGKFKGIDSSVTDLFIHDRLLFSSSLDSFVRVYNQESRELKEKHYMNKPIYSITVKNKHSEEQDQQQEEAVLSDQEQNAENEAQSKKIKMLRKRNKVNLKYLKPVNWDEVPISKQLLQQAKQQYEQINSKDADSDLQQKSDAIKNEYESNSQKDSDLD